MTKKIANIIIQDYVFVTVAGITPADTDHFIKEYAFYTKSYFHSPEYKLGRWDGKFKFFTPGNRTYCTLILDIAEELKEMGYKVKVKNKRSPFHFDAPTIDKDYFKDYDWEIAPHQLKAINNVLETHDGIVRVGTGGGKTLITGVLADVYRRAGYKTIIIVPNKDLIKQTRAKISIYGFEVGAFYGEEKDLNKDVVVSTWQSLGVNPKVLTMFDGFMVDECHGSKANTLFKLLSTYGKDMPIRIGLTGTLPDHACDLLKTHAVLGPVRATVPSHYLIKKGWLANLNLLMVKYLEDFTEEWENFKKVSEKKEDKNISYTEFRRYKLFPEYENEKNFLKRDTDRIQHIADIINTMTAEYGNSFILVNTIDFGKKLVKYLGDDAIFISSSIKDRTPIYDSFKSENGIEGVATFSLASTGLDVPRIYNLFAIDGGKSSIKVIQSIGRGLRKADDKDTVNMFDIYSDTKFSMSHAAKRKKIYKQEKYDYKEIKISIDESEKSVQKCLKAVKSYYKDKTKEDLEKEVF